MPAESKRTVISWFGWDIRDFELLEDRDLVHHLDCVGRLAGSLCLRVERRGNNIDLIIGKPGTSVSRREFYQFQRKWDELNEQLGIRMSGMLWLMTENGEDDPQAPREGYRLGVKAFGDSIGRPQRHSLPAAGHKREKARK